MSIIPGRGDRRWYGCRALAGYLLAAVCLVWVFHDVHLDTVWSTVRQLRWWLVALAILVDILAYITQGARWSLLLRSVGQVSWFDATQAIYAGLAD
jgi:uncharacterized membrane protein YbhN (UPF0104 family)